MRQNADRQECLSYKNLCRIDFFRNLFSSDIKAPIKTMLWPALLTSELCVFSTM
jgi:hypothetical protein